MENIRQQSTRSAGDMLFPQTGINYIALINLAAVHLGCFLIIWVGFSRTAFIVCLFSYFIRMFGITGGYHRYFSHRTYQTSQWFQFILACLGASALQGGPIWWSAHHRYHHNHADQDEDLHSPVKSGFFWAHTGWMLSKRSIRPDKNLVSDLLKFPELRFLNRYFWLVPLGLILFLYFAGISLNLFFPELHTSGLQLVVWGFFVSTTLLYHGTHTVNSFGHLFGSQRFQNSNNSRNNFLISLITLGEGWHNNHHRYPSSEPQGMMWWEIDVCHYVIKFLSIVGIVWSIKGHPSEIYGEIGERIEFTTS